MSTATTDRERSARHRGRPPRRGTAARERVEIRVPAALKERLLDAATLSGRSLSDFVIAAAERAAVETIHEHRIMTLSAEDSRLVAELLLDPPPPNEALLRAARRWQEWQERLATDDRVVEPVSG